MRLLSPKGDFELSTEKEMDFSCHIVFYLCLFVIKHTSISKERLMPNCWSTYMSSLNREKKQINIQILHNLKDF